MDKFFNRSIVTYVIILTLTLFALFLINTLNISYPITVKTLSASGELAVVGEGKVEVVPNSASVDVGISVVNASTVDDAQEKINTTHNNIVKALDELGIPKEQIKTSNYNINPTYVFEGGPERITGYSGNVTLTIKVKSVDQLPQVITAATKAGANQVFSTQLTVDEPEKYREEARTKAIDNAREQAEELAQELGIKLGKVVNIVESSPGTPGPVFYEKAIDGRGGGAAPEIQPGSQTITSTVTLYFEKR